MVEISDDVAAELLFGELRKYESNRELCSLIIHQLADLNVTNQDGETFLHLAVKGMHPDERDLLLERGVRVDIANDAGTALHIAAMNDALVSVELLIRAGSDVNALNKQGGSPLHHACVRGNAKIVQLLLNAGADADAINGLGESPLHLAARGASPDVLSLLLERGVRMDKECSRGGTPLHWAAYHGVGVNVRLLLNAGAPATSPKWRHGPDYWAERAGHAHIVSMLTEHGQSGLGEFLKSGG